MRSTDAAPSVGVINIQWYLATFGSGVFVQRGRRRNRPPTVNVPITSVTSMSQAFVLFSKTPVAADATWGTDDTVLGELTSATQLTFRTNGLNVGHSIAWQVVQFTNAADINVQKGSITTTDRRDAHRDGHAEPRGKRRQDVRPGQRPRD